MIYKEKIKKLREEQKITQIDLSKILEVDNSALSHYENEDIIIPIKHLITLCNFYNVSLDYIFSFTEVPNYNDSLNNIDKYISGQRLKEFRKENKITQDKLALLLNTNRSVIANYERGRTVIATPFLYTICKKYKISADYLLGRINNPKYL
ncbi:MAG: helix-turn-helix domain-containing protein [Ruminococcus sp.]|nr:helix-turn-helix domain-containing protein [Ruminococcus sp.]